MSSTGRDLILATSAATWRRLHAHLTGAHVERMAFGYCSAVSHNGRTRFLLHEVEFPTEGDYLRQDASRVVLGAADTIRYLIRAKGAAAFLDAHSHPFPGGPRPSATDDRAAARQHASLQGPSPGSSLVRMIVADGGIWADMHNGTDPPEPIQEIHIHGPFGFDLVRPVNGHPKRPPVFQDPARQDMDRRTLACLGEARLSRMRGLSVGVIGVGGVGSMVARLLAGVAGKLILIDPDRLEPHNAPRVWFAGIRSRGFKVAVAKRTLRRAFPELTVHSCAHSFPSKAAGELLSAVDFLFVCPDHNAVRSSASRYAAVHLLPLIEVGCGGLASQGALSALGYHVRLQVPGGPCLSCSGLDLSKLEDPSTTEAKRRLPYVEDGSNVEGELAPLTTRAAADAVDLFQRYCTGYPSGSPLHLYVDSLRLKTLDLTDTYSSLAGCPTCGLSEQWPLTPPIGISPSG